MDIFDKYSDDELEAAKSKFQDDPSMMGLLNYAISKREDKALDEPAPSVEEKDPSDIQNVTPAVSSQPAALLQRTVSEPPNQEPITSSQPAALLNATLPPAPNVRSSQAAAMLQATKPTEVEQQRDIASPDLTDSIVKAAIDARKTRMEEFNAAKKQSDFNALVDELVNASKQIGAGLGGIMGKGVVAPYQPKLKSSEEISRDANRPFEQLDQKTKAEYLDPTSDTSRSAQAMVAKALGKSPDDFKNTSAADLEKVLPQLSAIQQHKATMAHWAAQERHQAAMEKRADDKLQYLYDALNQKSGTAEQKAQEAKRKQIISTFEKSKTLMLARGGAQLQNNLKLLSQSENLFNTAGVSPDLTEKEISAMPDKSFDNLPRINVNEMGMEISRLLAQGVAAQGTINKVLPDDVLMDLAKLKEKITSNPKAANQGGFVKNYLKIGARVRDLYADKVNDHYSKAMAGNTHVLKEDPEAYFTFARQMGAFNTKTVRENYDKYKKEYDKKIASGEPLPSNWINPSLIKEDYSQYNAPKRETTTIDKPSSTAKMVTVKAKTGETAKMPEDKAKALVQRNKLYQIVE